MNDRITNGRGWGRALAALERQKQRETEQQQRQCELIAAILRGDYDHDDGLDDDEGGAG